MEVYQFCQTGACRYTRTLTVLASTREEALNEVAHGSRFFETWEHDDLFPYDTWDALSFIDKEEEKED